MGAWTLDPDPVRDPQHRAAPSLLHRAQSGVQQQIRHQISVVPQQRSAQRRGERPQKQQTRESENVLEPSETRHRGDGGERLPGRADKNMMEPEHTKLEITVLLQKGIAY